MTTRSSRGFTLIELLVVIAIIGILSSVVLASLNSARAKGRDARRISDLKQLQLALELYYDGNSTAPQTYPVATTAGGTDIATALTALAPTYISTIPDDPNASSGSYYYYSPTGGATYCLGANIEGTPPTSSAATVCSSLTTGSVDYKVAP